MVSNGSVTVERVCEECGDTFNARRWADHASCATTAAAQRVRAARQGGGSRARMACWPEAQLQDLAERLRNMSEQRALFDDDLSDELEDLPWDQFTNWLLPLLGDELPPVTPGVRAQMMRARLVQPKRPKRRASKPPASPTREPSGQVRPGL